MTSPREQVSRGDGPRFSSADLVAGCALILIGGAFAIGSLQYELGTLLQMGPGFFPLVLALIIVGVGVAVVIKGLVAPSRTITELQGGADDESAPVDGLAKALDEGVDAVATTEQPESFGRIPWRAVLLVTAALLWFALTIGVLGLLPAAFGTMMLAAYARSGARLLQSVLTAAGLTALSWLIFVVGLQLRVPLLGS